MIKQKLVNKTFKVDAKKLKDAQKKVDVPEAVRALIDEINGSSRCPCCAQKLK